MRRRHNLALVSSLANARQEKKDWKMSKRRTRPLLSCRSPLGLEAWTYLFNLASDVKSPQHHPSVEV